MIAAETKPEQKTPETIPTQKRQLPSLLKTGLPSLILMVGPTITGLILYGLDYPVYWPGFAAMVFFYGLIFYLGSAVSNKKELSDPNEMMLAGRALPLGIAIFTMSATWIGGGYINGTAEAAAGSGLIWIQAPWGYALSLIVGGLFFAVPMRKNNYKTMLDPIEQRFGTKMSAVLFLPALAGELFWTAAILTALGTTFGTVLGLDFSTSILLSAVIAVGYTALGGLWAVAVTDVIQLGFIIIGLGLAIPFALADTGGLAVLWTKYKAAMGFTATMVPPIPGTDDPNWAGTSWLWWDSMLLLIFGGIPWQVYFQRVLAARTPRIARRLSLLAGFVCILAAVPAVLIGMVGKVTDWAALGVAEPTPAMILPYVLRYLTHPAVAVIGLGAIAAAVMSSIDSSILSASSLACWNVYKPLFRPKISGEQLSKAIRKAIIIIGTAATILALKIQSVYSLWYLCSDFVYCILFPQLVAALFFRSANKWGSISGFLVSIVLRFGGGEPALGIPQFLPYPVVEGTISMPYKTLTMIAGLFVIFAVSRATAGRCAGTPLTAMEE